MMGIVLWYKLLYTAFWSLQMTTKVMAQQEDKLKKLESLNALTETNKMLKEEKNRLEQELQQNRAKARIHLINMAKTFIP